MMITQVLSLSAESKNAITLLPTEVQIVIGALLILCAVFLTVAVLMQEGKNSKLSGAIAGGSDSSFGKTKSKKMSDALSKATTIVAIVFVVIVLLLAIVNRELFLPNLNPSEPVESETPTESVTPSVTPTPTPSGEATPTPTPTPTPSGEATPTPTPEAGA